MARIRTIKPEFFQDEDLAKLEPLDRIAFEGLWCYADKAGRLEDRPHRLKVQILPYDTVDFDVILDRLSKAKFIIRYKIDSQKYIQIRTFLRHQRPHHTEPESIIPEHNGCETVTQRLSSRRKGKEGKGKEGKGKEEYVGGVLNSVQPAPIPLDPAIEVALTESPHFLTLKEEKFRPYWRSMQQAYRQYTWLDIPGEIRKAESWIEANPERCPTVKGLNRFFRNWIERAVNMGRTRQGADNGRGNKPADPYATWNVAWPCKACGEVHETKKGQPKVCPKQIPLSAVP